MDMGVRFDIRRYSAAEMVLLGIFVLGLLVASSLVRYRNKIRLSEPIRLPLAGLSVSLPAGGGWQHWHGRTTPDLCFSVSCGVDSVLHERHCVPSAFQQGRME